MGTTGCSCMVKHCQGINNNDDDDDDDDDNDDVDLTWNSLCKPYWHQPQIFVCLCSLGAGHKGRCHHAQHCCFKTGSHVGQVVHQLTENDSMFLIFLLWPS